MQHIFTLQRCVEPHSPYKLKNNNFKNKLLSCRYGSRRGVITSTSALPRCEFEIAPSVLREHKLRSRPQHKLRSNRILMSENTQQAITQMSQRNHPVLSRPKSQLAEQAITQCGEGTNYLLGSRHSYDRSRSRSSQFWATVSGDQRETPHTYY